MKKSKKPPTELKRKIIKIETPQTSIPQKMVSEEDKINVEFNKIMSERKTTLSSLLNQDWKKSR